MDTLILIVEDEKPIRHFIKVTLETQNYKCIEAQNGASALSLIAANNPDLVILDLGLPDIDGLDVIKKAREWSNVPIIVVSARGHEREKVEALDVGADDYLTKPFSVAELLARIRAALRRTAVDNNSEEEKSIFELGELKIDFEKRKVALKGKEMHFTPTEYNLIKLLCSYQGKVLTHKYLINEIWGTNSPDDTQTLRVCMANIRRKIEEDPAQPRYIITEVGIGYRMADE